MKGIQEFSAPFLQYFGSLKLFQNKMFKNIIKICIYFYVIYMTKDLYPEHL